MKDSPTRKKETILPAKGNAGNARLYSTEEFKALVNYERARSDRNGTVFSIIMFDLEVEDQSGTNAAIRKISEYSRSIDCIGLAAQGMVSVLLPDTEKHGADIFGQKVSVELKKIETKDVHYDLYCYPEHWLFMDKDREPLARNSYPEHHASQADFERLFIKRIPVWKRVIDISGSLLLLILTSPIFVVLAVYLKIVSPGPALFRQTRIGYRGIPFIFFKFRTMKCNSDQSFHGDHAQSFIKSGDIPMEKLDVKDPRIILGGKVIRKACIDELPQLVNVLRGEMSLVGPRPCIPYEAKEYLRWHTHRFDVLPGLSGLWQVSGKNKLTFKQMIRLDIAYCEKMSPWLDLLILLRTPIAIVKMVAEAAAGKFRKPAPDSNPLPMLNMPRKAAR